MDARKKKILLVLGAASLIFVWRVYGIVTKYMPSSAQAKPTAFDAESANAGLAASVALRAHEREAEGLMKAQEQAAKQPWGRDPFADVIAKEAPRETAPSEKKVSEERPPPLRMTFTGVSKVGDDWRAIISGRLVRIGEVIETDYRVSQITKRSITIQSKGWSMRYELGTEAPHVERLSEKP